MPKSTWMREAVLQYLVNLPGTLEVAYHSQELGVGSDQSLYEISYTGYARGEMVPQITGNVLTNSNLIEMGVCTSGTAVALAWSVGKNNVVFYSESFPLPVAINYGNNPSILQEHLIITEI